MSLKKNRFNQIIFDMDGVLWDSSQAHELAFKKTLSMFYDYHVPFDYAEIAGMKTEDAFKIILKNFDLENFDINKLTKYKREVFLSADIKHLKLNTALIEFIMAHISDSKFKFTIATSASYQSFLKFIDYSKIDKEMITFITSEMVKNAKPDPEIFNMVIDSNADRCIIVEDSHSGIKAGLLSEASDVIHYTAFVQNKISNDLIVNNNVRNIVKTEELVKWLTQL